MKYTIEEGIPLVQTKGETSAIYPWLKMKVGDSFFIPLGNNPKFRSMQTMCGQVGRKNGMKFKCRRVDGGFRIWRVE